MRRRALALAVASVVSLAACGTDGDGAVGSPSAATAADGPAETVAAGAESTAVSSTPGGSATSASLPTAAAPEALQFSAPLVGGGELDLRSLAGTTVALWFWAPT